MMSIALAFPVVVIDCHLCDSDFVSGSGVVAVVAGGGGVVVVVGGLVVSGVAVVAVPYTGVCDGADKRELGSATFGRVC